MTKANMDTKLIQKFKDYVYVEGMWITGLCVYKNGEGTNIY